VLAAVIRLKQESQVLLLVEAVPVLHPGLLGDGINHDQEKFKSLTLNWSQYATVYKLHQC
jgi:tRNA G37 N-methylase TrmD